MRNYDFTDPEYDRWFKRGYDSLADDGAVPSDASLEQRSAWYSGREQAETDRDEAAEAETEALPFCACGRRWSACDGSRSGCQS